MKTTMRRGLFSRRIVYKELRRTCVETTLRGVEFEGRGGGRTLGTSRNYPADDILAIR